MGWRILPTHDGLYALLHDDELIAIGSDPVVLLCAYGMFTGRSEPALLS